MAVGAHDIAGIGLVDRPALLERGGALAASVLVDGHVRSVGVVSSGREAPASVVEVTRAGTRGERWVASGAAATVVSAVVGTGVVVVVGSGDAVGSSPWRVTLVSTASSIAVGLVLVAALWWMRVGVPVRERDDPTTRQRRSLALLVPVACLALLVVSPRRFDSIAREDGFVEWVGALATACACVWAIGAARRHRGSERLLFGVAALVLFVLTGEELSWLQRLGGFGTPDAFDGNSQGEANLHNLATDRVQALYYLATFVALVLLPFVARWSWHPTRPLRALVPGSVPMVLAACSVGFAYARAGNLAHHLTFWATLGVLWWWSDGPRPGWTRVALAVVVVGQLLCIVVGPELARPWAPDEYREMLLGLSLAVWAREALERAPTPIDRQPKTLRATRAGASSDD